MVARLLTLASVLAIAGLYFGLGKFGLSLAFLNKSASAVWPPTGFALAILLIWGYRLWPGIFIGALLVNIETSLPTGIGIACGNTLEALAGAWLVRRFAGGVQALESPINVLKFVIFAVILSTSISATVGVTTLSVGGFARWDQYLAVWLTWFLGDAVSDLVVAPLLLAWLTKPLPRLRPARVLELAALLFTVVVICQIVFFDRVAFIAHPFSLEYLAILPVLWAAFRFEQRGAASCAVLISAFALWGTLHGFGPFITPDPNRSLMLLQAFMGTATLTALVLAAIVSSSKQAHQTLQASEARKAAILESALDAIITINHQSQITEVNSATEKIFGYTREEMVGKSMPELIVPARLREPHRRGMAHYRATGEGPILRKRIEMPALRKDGTEFPVELTVLPIKQDGLSLFTATLRDLTESKRAEDALRRWEYIFNHAGWGVAAADPQTNKLEMVNPAFAQMHGYSVQEMIGMPMIDTFAPESRKEFLSHTEMAHERGHYVYESLHIRKDGSKFPVLTQVTALKDEAGRITLRAATFQDITEQNKAEEALREAHVLLADKAKHLESLVEQRTAELRELVGELEAFSYSMAHDMRAPLRAMQGFAQVLSAEFAPQLGPTGQQYLSRIISAADRLDRLIQDVLQYSKVVRVELTPEPVSLDALVRDIIDTYPNLSAPNVAITIKDVLPSVIGNTAALTQVISNLLGNAVKFVKPGVNPRIRIWAQDSTTQTGAVRLWIEDNGIGIEKRAQQRIFQMFQQLNHPGTYEGTGIGLAIVRKAIERMGGKVGVESEPGKGSRFWIELKRADSP